MKKLLNRISNVAKKVLKKEKTINLIPFVTWINSELDKKPHKTVPAPEYLQDDPWFGPAIMSDENKEKYEHINDDPHDGWWLRPEEDTVEPENIHQVMYEMATKNKVHLGGSENLPY